MRKFIDYIKSLIGWGHGSAEYPSHLGDNHLEAKYWPEVMDYMKALQDIIKVNTIEGENVEQVNERITDYILEQINKKGSIDDIEKRYLALDTLADRILVVELSKIVGLKQNPGTRAEFSEATKQFKKRLALRHEAEKQKPV